MTEQDIINLVKNDSWMMSVLTEAEKLNLPDWMICAGFLRNKVWDHLHNIHHEVADTNDIDLVYYDSLNQNEEKDVQLSQTMKGKLGLDWEIVNQAYTHAWYNRRAEPYKNSEEAISEFVETATCVGVKLENGEVKIIAPHGIDDLVNLIIRPSPAGRIRKEIFNQRYVEKKWLEKWPKLKVVLD